MVLSVGKLAPSAVVLAFVGYCVWPSVLELASASQPPKPPPKLAELAGALFSPVMPPCPTKNPWGGGNLASLAAAKQSAKAADNPVGAPANSTGSKTTGKPVDPLSGLTLDATCILGDRRLAVINGRSYAAHEMLSTSNPATPGFTIASVLPYSVLLERDGKTVELTYSNATTRSGPSRGGSAPAKRTSTPGASGAKKVSPSAKSGGNSPAGTTGT